MLVNHPTAKDSRNFHFIKRDCSSPIWMRSTYLYLASRRTLNHLREMKIIQDKITRSYVLKLRVRGATKFRILWPQKVSD